MDSRADHYNLFSYRQQLRQLLGSFLQSLEHLDPWWVSIVIPVNGDHLTTLSSVLGFEYHVGLQFLAGTGLIKLHNEKTQTYSVVQAEWDKFILEEDLGDIMETVNRTTVTTTAGKRKAYFINYGNKKRLRHAPIDQIGSKQLFIIDRQQKFHRQVSNAVLAMRTSYQPKEQKQGSNISSESELEDSEVEEKESEDGGTYIHDTVIVSDADTPTLARLLGESKKVTRSFLNDLLLDLFKVVGMNSNAVEFEYKNGRKGCAVIVPKVKDYVSFHKEARRLRWLKSLLHHVAGSDSTEEDAAQWITTQIGKNYEAAFTLASQDLGFPLVQSMDEVSAEAMWSAANVNIVQQRIIRKHLKFHFGKRIFLPTKVFRDDRMQYNVETFYDCYKYYKNGDKMQKPEKCPFWTRDSSEIVCKELTKLLDYSLSNDVSSRLSSICSTRCTIVAGADQGQGAWRSWIKISTDSGEKIREQMATNSSYDPKTSYIISQVAHITCKKDNYEILSNTVAQRLSTGYEKLQASSLVFIKPPSEKSKVKAIFISKRASNIQIERDVTGSNKCVLTYFITGGEENTFTLKNVADETFEEGSKIICIVPSFEIFVTGDLAFYADVLGMPNSSSYWCPWCLSSRPEWQLLPSNQLSTERTAEFQQEMHEKILRDTRKQLNPTDKKGVSCEMQYKSLTINNFVPPLLHLEMGMVNLVWDDFELWIDNDVEMIPSHEQEARRKVSEASTLLDVAVAERKEADSTITIDIRQKKAELKVLKSELRRDRNPESIENLHTRIALLETFISEQTNAMKRLKDNVKNCQDQLLSWKKKMADYKMERGKPEASIVAEIEILLDQYRISRGSYHGGDFNGVCCRKLVGNAKPITVEIRRILIAKKNEQCNESAVNKKMDDLEQLLGLLDSAYAYLSILYPNETEKQNAENAVSALMHFWRNMSLNLTLKAHVIECHACPFNNKWGIGDKEESFVEQGHQVGAKDNSRYARLTNFVKKSESTLNARQKSTHPLVLEQQQKIEKATKKRSNESHVKNREMKLEAKRVKREAYVSNNKSNT
jgi:hypothetical protein